MVYSNPRRLLGEESRATICSAVELLSGQAVDGISFAISRHKSSACWRAAGKDSPDFNAFFKALEKASDSHCSRVAVFSNKEMSPDSLPKQRPSTQPSLSSRETAPAAKSPALPAAKQTGSSITTSAPASSAIRVRVYLVQKRRSAPLDKAAAHDCDQIVRAGLLPRLFHMVNMSRVKRVVFYDDACCFQSDKYLHVHGFLTF